MGMRGTLAVTLALSVSFAITPAALARHGKGRASRVAIARPVPDLAPDGRPNIQAQAAVIVDLASGGDYYARNPDAVRPIASISKLMAAIVAVDGGMKLDGTTTITAADAQMASRGARSRLVPGTTLTNLDLLHAALIASDNRAVPALGRAIGLNPTQMAEAMTKKARSLGLLHTEFKDPTGLDDGNVSTPREIVRMLKVALANPTLAEILKKPKYVAVPVGGRRGPIEYTNTDHLVRSGHWQILGGKTGYTDIARYCLVVAAKVGNRDVAMAFLGAEGKLTRFGDFTRAADWLLTHADLKPTPPPAAAGAATAAAESRPAAPLPTPATAQTGAPRLMPTSAQKPIAPAR
jgi:D-alanyl-D-alanine endopeptidase (penicillin-binding protein 7)